MKCEPYWPQDQANFGEFSVQLQECVSEHHIVIRTLKVRKVRQKYQRFCSLYKVCTLNVLKIWIVVRDGRLRGTGLGNGYG